MKVGKLEVTTLKAKKLDTDSVPDENSFFIASTDSKPSPYLSLFHRSLFHRHAQQIRITACLKISPKDLNGPSKY